ncbi:MAG TPA: CYTH domain-containing protein [Bacteroidales bacterium]|nr:CYTH domain-containing protein [Bacteroidales bacterium]HPI68195.1 CYTH domain-containing protein [Bacteroidales bacterium]HPR72577.1 CYTH domain-containing protein [Bacteroidales bacterium]
MGKETERKFLISGEFRHEKYICSKIKQAYISTVPDRTVRIRISDNRGFITIKGGSDLSGMCRFEWEKEISVKEAEDLLLLCEPGIIEKTRYRINKGKHTFEVDEFTGSNSGLIIAEIELAEEDEEFEKPEWLGKEVTGDPRFYNSYLSKNPFSKW